MERYDLDTEVQEGIVTTKLYKRKYGDWVKWEDAEDIESQLDYANHRLSTLEEELEDEREYSDKLEAELTEYENPV